MADNFEIYGAALAVSVAGFLALWGVSLLRRDASVVDFWWGPGVFAGLCAAVWVSGGVPGERGMLVLALVGAWALRLGVVLGRRRLREGHEDARYASLRAAWDPGFWWKSLFVVFLLQAVLQSVVAGGAIAASLGAAPLGLLGAFGAAVALGGLALEAAADAELDRFKRTARQGELCDSGLRAYVRHPNYLGEILFWVGIAAIGLEAGALMVLLSAALVAGLLVGLSGAPILDDHLGATRPAWRAYRARVPGFLPALGPQPRRRRSN